MTAPAPQAWQRPKGTRAELSPRKSRDSVGRWLRTRQAPAGATSWLCDLSRDTQPLQGPTSGLGKWPWEGPSRRVAMGISHMAVSVHHPGGPGTSAAPSPPPGSQPPALRVDAAQVPGRQSWWWLHGAPAAADVSLPSLESLPRCFSGDKKTRRQKRTPAGQSD